MLVVDDDHSVLSTVRSFLATRGSFRVAGDETADDALRHLHTSGGDVLIADVYLGGREEDGKALAKRVQQRYPRMAVVLTSTDAENDFAPCPDSCVCLRKPFGVNQLLEAINVALRQANDRVFNLVEPLDAAISFPSSSTKIMQVTIYDKPLLPAVGQRRKTMIDAVSRDDVVLLVDDN